jgi:integrase
VVVELDRDPVTGKRRRKSAGGFARKKEAQGALAELIRLQQEGRSVEQTRQTVREYLDEWLLTIRPTVAPNTWTSYRKLATSYAMPRIGAILLKQLKPVDLNRLYGELLQSGGVKGRPLSPRTVRYVHTIIHRSLRDAVRWGKLPRNVAELADPPKKGSPPDKATWTVAQIHRFLEHVADDRLKALWLLLITTGMRRGEVLGLRWTDVDLDAGVLSVRQSLIVTVDSEVRFSEPKTTRSRRAIALDQGTVAALRSHRVAQLSEKDAWGSAWTDTGLVFTRKDGSPIRPDVLRQLFERQVRNSCLPRLTVHGLRHTHATVALKAGVHPKIVSERLGHSSVALTMDVYSHVLEGMQAAAASVIGSIVFQTDPGKKPIAPNEPAH